MGVASRALVLGALCGHYLSNRVGADGLQLHSVLSFTQFRPMSPDVRTNAQRMGTGRVRSGEVGSARCDLPFHKRTGSDCTLRPVRTAGAKL